MKTVFGVICFLTLSIQGKTQYAKDSAEMATRLEIFMQNNRLMDIDKVLDYTYPKLFTIAPREQVKEAMENAFNSEELIIKLDSLKIVKIHPVFAVNQNRYAKITYSMIINMQLKGEGKDSADIKMFLEIMQTQYGEKNVTIDKSGNGINIFQEVDMAAIKDDLSPEWTFANLKKDDPLMDMLFEKDLIARFYSY
jgi:hypothetical protein